MELTDSLINQIKSLIIKAGEVALKEKHLGLTIEYKNNDHSPVTSADKKISDLIYDALSTITPEIEVICEERNPITLKNKSRFWLIDPIDSTVSYIKGLEYYTINIALIIDDVPILGFIYQPEKRKLYYTNIDNNLVIEQYNMVISTLNQQISRDKYIAITSANNFNQLTEDFLVHYSLNKVLHVPSSLKLCWIAEGIADVYPKFGDTMEWDIASGHALIISTGGNISNLNGIQVSYNKPHFKNHHFLAYSKRWYNRYINSNYTQCQNTKDFI